MIRRFFVAAACVVAANAAAAQQFVSRSEADLPTTDIHGPKLPAPVS